MKAKGKKSNQVHFPLKEKGKYIKFEMKQHHLMLTKISRVSLTNP
jgi:hypothetical protein